jgi:hypothetical protein
LINVKSLEFKAIAVLMEAKGMVQEPLCKEFVERNKEIIDTWISKLDSLTIYNMFIVQNPEFKSFAESFPQDTTTDVVGINFVSLLKHEEFYILYSKIDKANLKFYSKYFTDYMFKGKNMYSYWAVKENPLFLLTYGIGAGMKTEDYIKAKQESFQGI